MAKDQMSEIRDALNVVVERVYDSQKKLGHFLMDDVGELMVEDFTYFFADLQLEVSRAYEAYKASELEEESGVSVILSDVVLSCLGLCRRLGHDVGELVLARVLAEAQEAAKAETEIYSVPEGPEEGVEGEEEAEEANEVAEVSP